MADNKKGGAADYKKKLASQLNGYAEKAAVLEKEDPFYAAQVYAKLGAYNPGYTKKARNIAKTFENQEDIKAAGMVYAIINRYTPNKADKQKAEKAAAYFKDKGDEEAATQILSSVSKKQAEEYAKGLEALRKYDQASVSYIHSGNYKKAKEMIGKAVGKNQTTGALKALKILDSIERKSAGIADAYEKQQQQQKGSEEGEAEGEN